MTIRERLGGLDGVRVAYLGDGNNVCDSLMRDRARGSAMQLRGRAAPRATSRRRRSWRPRRRMRPRAAAA